MPLMPRKRATATVIEQAQARQPGTPYYPMESYRGLSAIPNPARNNGEDIDNTPRQFRRVVNASGLQDMQIHNGMKWGTLRGVLKLPVMPADYFWGNAAQIPVIPGQTRGDVSGFHKRGPSSYNIQNMLQAGPGSQPANPGGPGQIAGTTLINPMSG
jgi:hypothetical protein